MAVNIKKILKPLQYIFEAILVYPIFFIFSLLPRQVSGKLVAKLLGFLGKTHSTNKVAISNISQSFPELSVEKVSDIANKAWQNLGKTAGEFPHVTKATTAELSELIEYKTSKNLQAAKAKNSSIIHVSAHIGNWELASRTLLEKDPATALIYRKAKNPLVEYIIRKYRDKYVEKIISKGEVAGFKEIVKHIRSGGSLGILADQHLTSGVEIEFFGRKVRAPKTPAEMAKKFDIPILMSRVINVEDGKYILHSEPPILDAKERTIEDITKEIYSVYEKWITETPEQWFWMHKRWRKLPPS